MKLNNKLLYTFFLLAMSIVACKKDEPETSDPFIAPCSTPETHFDKDSFYFGPSYYNPEAKYTVRFIDTFANGSVGGSVEYSFNKIPTSGKYNLVYKIDTNNLNNINQMAFVTDSGSFLWRSGNTEGYEVYIKKNSQELIISFCEISDSVFFFHSIDNCYVGTNPTSLKIRKKF